MTKEAKTAFYHAKNKLKKEGVSFKPAGSSENKDNDQYKKQQRTISKLQQQLKDKDKNKNTTQEAAGSTTGEASINKLTFAKVLKKMLK